MTLRKVNKEAAAVLDYLWNAAEAAEGHTRLDNNPAFMAVSLEILPGDLLSVCHYAEQNGDLMRDPEIVYWRHDGEYYPQEVTMDFCGRYSRCLIFDGAGRPQRYNPAEMKDLALFTADWMKNIELQQKLTITPRPARIDPVRRMVNAARKAAECSPAAPDRCPLGF